MVVETQQRVTKLQKVIKVKIQQGVIQKGNTKQIYWQKKKRKAKKTTSQNKGVNEIEIKKTIEHAIETQANLLKGT